MYRGTLIVRVAWVLFALWCFTTGALSCSEDTDTIGGGGTGADTDTDTDTDTDADCGSEPPEISGNFSTSFSSIEFDNATVDIQHKRDIDEEEDGCISTIDVHLFAGEGCGLHLVAGGEYAPEGLVVQQATFSADSFCPGFSDDEEGEYSDTGELIAHIESGVQEVPGDNVAEVCFETTLTIKLSGSMERASPPKTMDIAYSIITLEGEFISSGDTGVSCPEGAGDTDTDTDTDTDSDTDSDSDTDTDIDTDTDTDSDTDSDSDSDTDTDIDTDTDSDSDSDTDTDTDTDTDVPECSSLHQVELSWADAEIESPMEIHESGNGMSYIETSQEGQGYAYLPFDLPCHDTWYIWGLGAAAFGMGSPNKFFAKVNDGPEAEWELSGSMTLDWLWNLGETDGNVWQVNQGPVQGDGWHHFIVRGGDSGIIGFAAPKLGTIIFVNDFAWEP